MGRRLLTDFHAGQVFTSLVVRGKCRYGDRHESVRLVGDEWLGESSGGPECDYAPPDPCPVCDTAGEVEISAAEATTMQYDGAQASEDARRLRKPCLECRGSGYVPGPHWPWRHEHPGPLRPRNH